MEKKSFIDNLKSLAIIIAVAILIPMLTYHGSTLISASPNYSMQPATVKLQGVYLNNSQKITAFIKAKSYTSVKELTMLQAKLKAQQQFESKDKQYRKTLFNVCVSVGVLFLILGLIVKLDILDTGFILGGILSIIKGYTTYWGWLSNSIQFVSLLVALCLVVTITYYKVIKGASRKKS